MLKHLLLLHHLISRPSATHSDNDKLLLAVCCLPPFHYSRLSARHTSAGDSTSPIMPPFINNPLPSSMRSEYRPDFFLEWQRGLAQEAAMGGIRGSKSGIRTLRRSTGHYCNAIRVRFPLLAISSTIPRHAGVLSHMLPLMRPQLARLCHSKCIPVKLTILFRRM